MTRLAATGAYAVVSSGFVAVGQRDQSEGRGGTIDLGRFTHVDEAIEAARRTGVQGDDGGVSAFEVRLYDGGLIVEHTTALRARRRVPDGRYLVGWLDLREYADTSTDAPV